MKPSPPTTLPYSWRNFNADTRRLYITDADQADVELTKAFQTTPRDSCGIDIEWRPTFQKGQPENPVALVQLATVDTILLLHLCHMKHFPKKLQTLLEDPSVVKAGVGIQGDARKIFKDCSVNLRNCVDLSLLARSVDARWKGRYSEPIGLARLIAAYEDRLLSKGKITRSNWENYLDSEQQEYASNDGHAGYILYTRLSRMIPTMPKPPNATCYSFDVIRGRLCESSGMTWSPFNPDYDPGPPPPPKPVPGPSLRTSTGAVALSLGNSGLKRPLARDSSSHTLVGNKAGGDHDDSNSTSTPTVKRPRRYRQRPRRPA